MEFSNAGFGAIGLQTVFAALNTHLGDKIGMDLMCQKLSAGPRAVLGLDPILIKEGEKAELTLFDPSIEWTFDNSYNKSRSSNSPFIGKELKGKVIGIINGKSSSF
jgi:dihydroorotase